MENSTQNNTLYITNIKWHCKRSVKAALSCRADDLPAEFSLSVPGYLLALKDSDDQQKFKDEIETFVFNFLNKTYKTEVSFCQIWLPLNTAT